MLFIFSHYHVQVNALGSLNVKQTPIAELSSLVEQIYTFRHTNKMYIQINYHGALEDS